MDAISRCAVHQPWNITLKVSSTVVDNRSFGFKGVESGFLGLKIVQSSGKIYNHWSFIGGSRPAFIQPNCLIFAPCKRIHCPSVSCFLGSQLASSAFTLGTVAVLPFYTMMVLAPKSELTRKSMESIIPYVVLGVAYAYLLYLSWTPDTIKFMFASKYWLPELSSMAKMFSSEMTLASAWLHLVLVDLFAARQIFFDGLNNKVETRHSVSLCLFFCPVGIIIHAVTKRLTKEANHTE